MLERRRGSRHVRHVRLLRGARLAVGRHIRPAMINAAQNAPLQPARRLGGNLQKQPLLRVHQRRLGGRQPEGTCIKVGCTGQEDAEARRRVAGGQVEAGVLDIIPFEGHARGGVGAEALGPHVARDAVAPGAHRKRRGSAAYAVGGSREGARREQRPRRRRCRTEHAGLCGRWRRAKLRR